MQLHRMIFISKSYAEPACDAGLKMPAGHEGPVPQGLALTLELIEALRSAGWDLPFHWATDYSHAFEARRHRDRFDVMVHCTDAEAGRWTVTAETQTTLLRWLRKEPAALQQLADALRTLLEANPEIGDLTAELVSS